MNKKQIQQKIKKWQQINPNAGYTIMEGLVAMIMVAFLMSAIAPVIALSVGTRVQARRIELASQAATSYIDWVRIDPTQNSPNLTLNNLDDAPSPTSGNLECNDGEICTTPTSAVFNDLYCIDGDGDGECTTNSVTDMVVQGVRSAFTQNENQGYALGVRVYRADAFQETSLCPDGTNCPDEATQQSTVTNAIGNRRLPVVEMVTDIAPADLNGSFQNLCDRFARQEGEDPNSICP
ncbi:hormogonium polysaccharide secretion pseudopilin HpsB [Dapis sp. BLCC M126]|uniref:hormogonium polysaccharide secretion pseudopilin HpsB n=1 Tax=Dapis sp. BLCC M126 TaxID=3400189 RepID=UPI003CEE9EB0